MATGWLLVTLGSGGLALIEFLQTTISFMK